MGKSDTFVLLNVITVGLACFFLIAGYFGGMRITVRSILFGIGFGVVGSILQYRYHYSATAYLDTVATVSYPAFVVFLVLLLPLEEIVFFGVIISVCFVVANVFRDAAKLLSMPKQA